MTLHSTTVVVIVIFDRLESTPPKNWRRSAVDVSGHSQASGI